jgi:ElaB/YqjD/DUF883 family membrane-anchored ribosome-binding protein
LPLRQNTAAIVRCGFNFENLKEREMVSSVKDLPTDTNEAGATQEASTVAELRASVNEIAKELSEVAERRTRAARQQVEAGADALRGTIRRQPVLAIGVAVAAGAVLATLVVPRGRRTPRTDSWSAWAPSMPVTRADLHDVADSIQRTVSRAASSVHSVPLTSSLERFVDVMSKVEPSASLNSALEKAGGWFQKVQSRASDAVKK